MSLSRVCIQTDVGDHPMAVDVALPSGAPVADLLPAIVDLVDGHVADDGTARRWRLTRLAGAALDESLSLTDNAVRDGELLFLTTGQAPTLGAPRRSVHREACASGRSGCRVEGFLPATVCVLATALAAVVLGWAAGTEMATEHAIIAAAGAAVAVGVTMAAGHPPASSLAVVSLAGAAGFLAVPSGPAAPNVFLAATAAGSASLLMMKLCGRASPALTAAAGAALLVALVTLVPMPGAAVGAALAIAALALLALAPRVSVLTAGLGPDRCQDGLPERAAAGHAILSGLVIGACACAVAGVVVVAGAQLADETPAIVFTGLVAAVLLLRARTHVESARRIALVAAGLAGAMVCLAVTVASHRGGSGPVAGALLAVGLYAVRGKTWGPAVWRTIDRLEYVALAAVVPAACWVAGVYTAVGGFSLR